MAVRLSRLGEAYRRSKEAHADDKAALQAAIQEADSEGVPVREVAQKVGLSPSHTHRLMSGSGN